MRLGLGISLPHIRKVSSDGGGGAPPFESPDDIDGLALWLDAQNNGTSTVENAPILNWLDQSAELNNFEAPDSGTSPIFKGNQLNGLGVLRFDGEDDQMSSGSNVILASHCTVFVVTKWLEATRPFMIEHGPNTNSTDGFFFAGFDGFVWGMRRTSLHADQGPTGGGEQYVGTAWRTLTFRYNENPVYRMDGVEQPAVDVQGSHVGNSTTSQILNIISRSPSSFGRSTCDVAEIIIYNAALTDEQVLDVEGYLQDKYAHY